MRAVFEPLADADWPLEIDDLRSTFVGKLNVYRVIARHPALLKSWLSFRDQIVVRNSLGRTRSEVTILRAAWRFKSVYEWSHHVSRARAGGLSDDRIVSLSGPLAGMTKDDAIFAEAVDQLADQHRLSRSLHEQIFDLVGTHGLFDLIATVGHYATLAFFVNTFCTPIDPEIQDELTRSPIACIPT